MQLTLLKSKIHRAQVTGVHRDYSGSLTIDSDLMKEAGLLPHEKVLVGNLDNGERHGFTSNVKNAHCNLSAFNKTLDQAGTII